jgi:virginiamycin B lyase
MADQIGRITTTGWITEYPLRTPAARPHAITAGADGALWFTQWGSNHIAQITVTGEVSEHAIRSPGSEPHGIATGPDGALWFAEETGKIGRLVPA